MIKNSQSLVERIAAVLEKRLRDGFYPANKALPGSRSIAEEFGCSFQTADRAILKLVDAQLLERRRGSGTYPLRRKMRILLLLPQTDQANYYYGHNHALIHHIYSQSAVEALQEYDCIFEKMTFQELTMRNFSPQLLRNIDGVLAHTTFSDENTFNLLTNSNCQLVYFGPGTAVWPMNSVTADWQCGMRKMFRCYSPKKKRFIIYDTPGSHNTPGNVAYELFQAARACGVTAERLKYYQIPLKSGQTAELEAYKLGMKLELDPHTVVVCTSDLLGFGFYDAFRDRGMQPGEFELISCDNLESRGITPYDTPQLTSIDHPKEAITFQAAQLLFEQIKSAGTNRISINIPTRLVFRNSGLTHYKENI